MQSWWCSYLVLQGKAPSRDSPPDLRLAAPAFLCWFGSLQGGVVRPTSRLCPTPRDACFFQLESLPRYALLCALPHDDLKMPRVFPLQNACHSSMRFAVC